MRRAILAACCCASPALADFDRVTDRNTFLSLVSGRDLTRLGISLKVDATTIRGNAFGTPVTGDWVWRDGYFCRSLYYGKKNLGDNCQEVKVDGRTIRFTSDRGQGQFADLTLR